MRLHEAGEGLGGEVEEGGVVGGGVVGAEVGFEVVLQGEEGFGEAGEGGGGELLLLELGAGGADEEDLQKGEQDLGMGEAGVVEFAADFLKEGGGFGGLGGGETDDGDAAGFVEQDAVAADFFVVGFDAEEVGVELEGEAFEGRIGDEAVALVRDKEEEGVFGERVLAGLGAEEAAAVADPENGEIVGAAGEGGFGGREGFEKEREIAVARVVELEGRLGRRGGAGDHQNQGSTRRFVRK
jgi:hypothetical protein